MAKNNITFVFITLIVIVALVGLVLINTGFFKTVGKVVNELRIDANSLTGNVPHTVNKPSATKKGECKTGEKEDIYTKDDITATDPKYGYKTTFEDSCDKNDNKYVQESVCRSGKATYERKYCGNNFVCDKGVCVSALKAKKLTCKRDESSLSVVGNFGDGSVFNIRDKCLTTRYLTKQTCRNNDIYPITIDCEPGACVEDHCVKEKPKPTCKRDDVRKSIVGTYEGGGNYEYTDKCDNERTLRENYCDKNNKPTDKYTYCKCQNDACVIELPAPTITQVDYVDCNAQVEKNSNRGYVQVLATDYSKGNLPITKKNFYDYCQKSGNKYILMKRVCVATGIQSTPTNCDCINNVCDNKLLAKR